MKTFYIKTLGCKVNQYDSQVIREQFFDSGFQEVSIKDNPDICIVNTCSVTARAQAKGRNYINRLSRQYPKATLVVTGCTVDYQPESISGKADFLIGNQNKSCLMNIVMRAEKVNKSKNVTKFANRTRAFVKVQDGCNEFCSYCILPYIRGRSKSRDLDSIISEVERLVNNGYREIVLTGIHLGDYGKDKGKTDAFVKLLAKIERIPQLIRIRLSSLEPQDITEALIEKVAYSKKICHHFHLPLQSGDDLILSRMNRRYTYNQYKDLINIIVSKIPDIVFTTDIIVGFPGESEVQFLNSCRVVEEIGFAKVHIFPYSTREGTVSAKLSGRVSSLNIKNRARILQKAALNSVLNEKKKLIGSFQWVLIEKSGRNSAHTPKSLLCGYTSGYIATIVKGPVVPNTLVKVRIIGVDAQYLVGEKI